jgi:hypothetical protein
MINQKPKKSLFIHKIISNLNNEEMLYCENLKKVLDNKSNIEIIAYIPKAVSHDNRERPLILSNEIVDKIQFDHGHICPENMIINAHEWEYILMYKYKDIDKINLIKRIPDSHNYLLIAANRFNGFFIVTHFETQSIDNKNLKRLLNRGNVISRGPSVCL